jgi:plastocyanin
MRAARFLLGFAVVVIMVVSVLGCGGGTAAAVTPPPGADQTISARYGDFDPGEIRATAGEPFEVFFKNLDPEPHNIAIYTDSSASESLFTGEIITDAAVLYEVPALDVGELFFRCDVHPNMTGTVAIAG